MGLIPREMPDDWFSGDYNEREEQKRATWDDSIRLTGRGRVGAWRRFLDWLLRRG